MDFWSQKLSGVPKKLDFLNFGSKFMFSDKNQYELIPNTPYLVKKWPFPGEFQSSSEFQEDSRSDGILEFRIKNQVSWQKLSGKNTLHVEFSENLANPGGSRISGILDSRVKKSKVASKSAEKQYKYATRVISFFI